MHKMHVATSESRTSRAGIASKLMFALKPSGEPMGVNVEMHLASWAFCTFELC